MPTIRTLAPTDRPALEAALRSDGTFRDDEIAVALELIDDALKGSDDYWIRVAEHGDRVGGYICYGPTPMTESTYDLYWVVVHAESRGHGLATKLVAAMEADLRERNATGIRVETSELEGYGAARKLYDRLDYPEASRLDDFYSAGDALITYYKRL
jgi:ribosomal protein S18 acetylase RimI-like enzyme